MDKLALQKGDDSVKKFAQQMITDHEKTSAELKALIDSGKVKGAPVAALTEDDKKRVDDSANSRRPTSSKNMSMSRSTRMKMQSISSSAIPKKVRMLTLRLGQPRLFLLSSIII